MKVCLYLKDTRPNEVELKDFNLVIFQNYTLLDCTDNKKELLRDFRIRANSFTENFSYFEKIYDSLVIEGYPSNDPLLIKCFRNELSNMLVPFIERVNTFNLIKETYFEANFYLKSDDHIDTLAYYTIFSNTIDNSKISANDIARGRISYLLLILFKKVLDLFKRKKKLKKFVCFNTGERQDAFISQVIGKSKISVIDDLVKYSYGSKNNSILSYVSIFYILKLLVSGCYLNIKFNEDDCLIHLEENYAFSVLYALNQKTIKILIYTQLLRINAIREIEEETGEGIALFNNCRGIYAYYFKKLKVMSYCFSTVYDAFRVNGDFIRVDKLLVNSTIDRDILLKRGVSEDKVVCVGVMVTDNMNSSSVCDKKLVVIFSTDFLHSESWGFYPDDWNLIARNIETLINNNKNYRFIVKLHPAESRDESSKWDFTQKHSNVEVLRNSDAEQLVNASLLSISFNSTVSFHATLRKKVSLNICPSEMLDIDPFHLRKFKAQFFLPGAKNIDKCFKKLVANRKINSFLMEKMDIYKSFYSDFNKDEFFKEIGKM